MGTWGNGIKDNDTSSDIYDDFFELYNEGKYPDEISKQLLSENQELIEDPDDCNNFWFALALAQWETKSLDPEVFKKVKDIIDSEVDLKVWKELEADASDIKKRKVILLKFLEKLQSDRKKPKPREKIKSVIGTGIFPKGTCFTFKLENGNYGGAIVLEIEEDHKYGAHNYIATCRLNQSTKPTTKDFENTEVLIKNFFKNDKPRPEIIWYNSEGFAKSKDQFEVIGSIQIDKKFHYGGVGTITTYGWSYIKIDSDRQIEFEKDNPKPTQRITIYQLTKDKKWREF